MRGIVVMLLVSLSTLLAAPAVASAPVPSLPHYFYGALKIDGADTPAGTSVEARVTGALTGSFNPVVTTQVGKYGDANPSANVPRLLV